MLSCTASELRLSGRFDVNRVDDVEELFDHRHLLVHEVDLTVDGLEQKETKLYLDYSKLLNYAKNVDKKYKKFTRKCNGEFKKAYLLEKE